MIAGMTATTITLTKTRRTENEQKNEKYRSVTHKLKYNSYVCISSSGLQMLAAVSGSLITIGLGLRIIFVGRLVKTAKSNIITNNNNDNRYKRRKVNINNKRTFQSRANNKISGPKNSRNSHCTHFPLLCTPIPPFRLKTTKSCVSYS